MRRLVGRLAAAASALVLALGLFSVEASAAKDKKNKNKDKDESSVSETVAESEEPAEAAEEDTEEHDLENFHRSGAWGYTLLPDNTASISKYYGDSAHPGIPESLDGFPVTAISGGWYAEDDGTVLIYGNIHGISYDDHGMIAGSSVYSPFSGNTKITEITIPDSVKYVGAISFKGCKKLQKVNFGKGVRVIGNNCFENCASLTAVTIPETVKYIDLNAFSGCSSLAEINVPEAHLEPAIFENCTSLGKAVLGKTTTVPQSMFSGCTGLTDVAIPNGARSIGDSAFAGCTSLAVIVIPDTVKEIHNSAFAGDTSLVNVKMSSKIEMIGNSAFADCPIKNLELPDSLTRIGKTAFGMKADGTPIEGFELTCPEYSPAQSYAQNNGLIADAVKGSAPASASAAEVLSPEDDDNDGEKPKEPDDMLNSDLMYKLLLVIIGVTAFSVLLAIILIIKNHSMGDEPEIEEYFPSGGSPEPNGNGGDPDGLQFGANNAPENYGYDNDGYDADSEQLPELPPIDSGYDGYGREEFGLDADGYGGNDLVQDGGYGREEFGLGSDSSDGYGSYSPSEEAGGYPSSFADNYGKRGSGTGRPDFGFGSDTSPRSGSDTGYGKRPDLGFGSDHWSGQQ